MRKLPATATPSACGRARLSSTLHEKLIDDGALREHGKLPPVLPIVIYNGGQRWTAAEDVAAMVAFGGEALAAYQPSLRYCLLDEGERAETIFHAETWYRC